jgi:hypothetical protein
VLIFYVGFALTARGDQASLTDAFCRMTALAIAYYSIARIGWRSTRVARIVDGRRYFDRKTKGGLTHSAKWGEWDLHQRYTFIPRLRLARLFDYSGVAATGRLLERASKPL